MQFTLTPPPAASGLIEPTSPRPNPNPAGTRGVPLDVTSSLRSMGIDVAKIPRAVLSEISKLSVDELQYLVAVNRKMGEHESDEVNGYVLF